MDQDAIQQLINVIQSLSPEMWRIALKQVQYNLLMNQITAVVLLIAFIAFVVLAIKANSTAKEKHKAGQIHSADNWCCIAFFSLVIGLGCLIGSIGYIMATLQYTMNPEYSAIQNILSLTGMK